MPRAPRAVCDAEAVIILETLVRRWYVFGFIALFFWAASAERGWRRSLRFLAIAGFIEFIAEFASTRVGVPFGGYEYTAMSQGQELYLTNIPLFVPVSFGVAVWAGRSLAQVGMRARTPGRLIVVGALTAAALDLIIDPMTLRGRQWFLGPLYQFDSTTGWFGVPWTNALGWIAVSGAVLWVDELFEVGRTRTSEAIRGPTLAVIIGAFFLVMALITRNWAILLGQFAVAGVLWALCAANIAEAAAGAQRPPPEETATDEPDEA